MLQWNSKFTRLVAGRPARRARGRGSATSLGRSTSPGSASSMSGRALPPARLLAVVAPVSLVGVAAFCAATFFFLRDPGSTTTVVGVLAFLVASTLAERFPVPVEGADANGVSLGFVFTVAALVLFGWAPATFIYVTAPTLVALIRQRKAADPHRLQRGRLRDRRRDRGLDAAPSARLDARRDPAKVVAMAAILYVVNILLVTAAIAASGSETRVLEADPLERALDDLPFTLMASTRADARRALAAHPVPLRRARGPARRDLALPALDAPRAERDAARAHRPADGARQPPALPRAPAARARAGRRAAGSSRCAFSTSTTSSGSTTSFGHPAGDRVLSQVAARLRQGGEAFRLGGDEFAVLLSGHRRAAGARDRAVDRRAHRRDATSARSARSPSAPASRRSRSTAASATR